MAHLNKVMIIGNLGRDPEIRATPSGQKVANFSVACTEKYKGKDGNRQERTEWFNCQVWGGQAEVVERYLKKGSSVYCEGRLQTRSWDKDGQKQFRTEMIVNAFQMLGGRQEQGTQNTHNTQNDGPPPMDDDLPFQPRQGKGSSLTMHKTLATETEVKGLPPFFQQRKEYE